LAVLLTGGCQRGDDTSARLDLLEARLDKENERGAEVAEALDRFDTDLRDLERRLGAIAVRRQRGPVRDPLSDASDIERRAQLRTLGREFREKRAVIQEQYGNDKESPEYRAAMSELMRERRTRTQSLFRARREGTGDGVPGGTE